MSASISFSHLIYIFFLSETGGPNMAEMLLERLSTLYVNFILFRIPSMSNVNVKITLLDNFIHLKDFFKHLCGSQVTDKGDHIHCKV
jgi:hypothetical protein